MTPSATTLYTMHQAQSWMHIASLQSCKALQLLVHFLATGKRENDVVSLILPCLSLCSIRTYWESILAFKNGITIGISQPRKLSHFGVKVSRNWFSKSLHAKVFGPYSLAQWMIACPIHKTSFSNYSRYMHIYLLTNYNHVHLHNHYAPYK